MKSATPRAAGFSAGDELGRLGRARRFESTRGFELWRLPAEDRAVALRLERLGARGVGGFSVAGQDDAGVWLARAPADPTLSRWIKERRELPWLSAVRLSASLATALETCESESLFPGPLSPSTVSVREANLTTELRADALVRTLVGAGGREDLSLAGDSASPRWIAPEQAAGAAWDNAANRYVLGLILYRMLAGEHAFGGKGLRLGLEEQARRAPPPLPEAIAAELPPGLQALCLRLLDPEPRQRPQSAAEIVDRLATFYGAERRRESPASLPAAPGDEPPPSAASVSPRRERVANRRSRWALTLAPLIVGSALAALVLALVERAPPERRRPLRRPPVSVSTTLAEDCASCHPRQAGEWHRSVMAHSVKSPMFQALEILIEEQAGRDQDCPNGAGILRTAGAGACRDRVSGLAVTGSGGELWCVNCHAPAKNLGDALLAWDGRSFDDRSRRPLRDLLSEQAMEGISCGFCHQVHGPVRPGDLSRRGYEGNPFWTSTRTGERFPTRPEDRRGLFGISNSGYAIDPVELIAATGAELVPGGAHARPSTAARQHLESSEFCGACHDVRLFGTDVIGARRGEHFKRLRNAYSEWATWAESERRAGRSPASCQDCHMSTYPGVCVSDAAPARADSGFVRTAFERACAKPLVFSPRPPGARPQGRVATSSSSSVPVRPHYFSGIDLPLTEEFPLALADEPTVDAAGIPLGARQRRDLLLAASVRLGVDGAALHGRQLEIPLVIENVGAGHRVPAGFSQERELWVHLRVVDGNGALVYEVGRVDRDDEDLRDKVFLRVNTDERVHNAVGQPLGVFGADVADGPDLPRWSPDPSRGGTRFRGRGLVNFQNGFLRCVTCIGSVDSLGRCQPLPGQERARADRYSDGSYDLDTGECRSNLSGDAALFETYFPVGSLDATRGVFKGPDAIIDTRSLAPGVPVTYVYELGTRGSPPPYRIEARLLFRAFPPYLVRAFADYERRQAQAGKRPSGALITERALQRIEVVELGRAGAVVR